MSKIDVMHQETLKKLLNEPWEVDNRAKWGDGSPVMTKRIPFVVNEYDLSKEFPASTIRPVPFKTCFREIDWIYRQRSNNVNDFKGKIWDSWADEAGSIGKAYGYQIAKPVFGHPSQMDYILEEGKKNPTSRRLVMEMWNPDDLAEMNLPPCAHHVQVIFKGGYANMIVKQRSQDFITANFFNVCEYALLLVQIAIHCGQKPGKLLHVIGDCHLYNKHEEFAKELLTREPMKTPKLWVNPEITNFYDFTEDDFKLIDYETHPQITDIDVAI